MPFTELIDRPSATEGGSQPPRVLLLTDSDVFAGTERHLLELAEGLRELRVPVRIGCPHPSVLGTRAAASDLPTVTIQKGGLWDRPAIRTITDLLVAGEIDIVHAHNGRTGLSSAVSTSRSGVGVSIATQHFIEPGRLRQGFIQRTLRAYAHRWTNARISHFIAISGAVRDAMLERRDAEPARITIVPNGISAPAPASSEIAKIRTEFGIPADAPLIVCVARLEREKDIPTLISAMQAVIATTPNARCLLVGDGSDRAALQAQIDAAHLSAAVTLTGFRRDSLAFIAAADVFVLPSLAEPFGLAILEAMALARPVVAVNAGGPREIVLDRETGRLVPPADPLALSAAITAFMADSTMRSQMGEKGRDRYSEYYTTLQMARATLAVYEHALTLQRGRSVAKRR